MNKHEFNVVMTCEGCSGAITKLLNKQKEKGEIGDFEVNLAEQQVFVNSVKDSEEITEMLKKSGKQVTHKKTEKAETEGN
ncbi:copper transport protein ATOX1 [Folsomia candida]|uniref:copper transport protein ATOX1 n=1 Tax=Folsomia candida TaxID=158441 RepID=UPI000B8F4546|nr:copper transport protein ATOX1 [Folsomia candida]